MVGRSTRQVREAFRIVRTDRNIAGPLMMMAFVGTLTYEFETSLPIFAEQTLRAGVYGYSWLTTAFGVGAVMAGLILVKWPQLGLTWSGWLRATGRRWRRSRTVPPCVPVSRLPFWWARSGSLLDDRQQHHSARGPAADAEARHRAMDHRFRRFYADRGGGCRGDRALLRRPRRPGGRRCRLHRRRDRPAP
jgi:hypothetical protein